jgi:NRPS condensation-like uncharacterized protein
MKKHVPWIRNMIFPRIIPALFKAITEKPNRDTIPLFNKASFEERKEILLTDKIDRETLKKNLKYCKENKITFHSYLCGIIIDTLKSVLKLKNSFRINISTPIGLRNYLDCNDEIMGNYNSHKDVVNVIDEKKDVLQYAQEFQDCFKTGLLDDIAKSFDSYDLSSYLCDKFGENMKNERKNENRNNS